VKAQAKQSFIWRQGFILHPVWRRLLLLRQAQGNHRDLPAEFRDTGGFHLGAVYILDQDKISILTDGYQSIHIQLTRSSLSSPTAACIREFRKPGLSSWKKLPRGMLQAVTCRRVLLLHRQPTSATGDCHSCQPVSWE